MLRYKGCSYKRFKLSCFRRNLQPVLQKLIFFTIYLTSLIGISMTIFKLGRSLSLYKDLRVPGISFHNLRPGLTVLPMPNSMTSLIRYKNNKRYSFGSYVHDLFGFVQNYERHFEKSDLTDCTYQTSQALLPRYSCKFPSDIPNIGCNIGNYFGYTSADPCVLIHVNRIIGWLPEFHWSSLNGSSKNGFPAIKILCNGISDFDKENIGRICYYDEESLVRKSAQIYPGGGCRIEHGEIRNYYFPYKKQISYQIPFVWVKFIGMTRNVVIMVQCWAIADREIGNVKFEILID